LNNGIREQQCWIEIGESKRKEERLRGKKKTGEGAPKQEQQQNRP